MNETKADPKGSSSKNQERAPNATTVTEIRGTVQHPLAERHFRVVEKLDYPALKERGLEPLVRSRGISERNANRAGIPVPNKTEG